MFCFTCQALLIIVELAPVIIVFPLESRSSLMNVPWIVPGAYVIKVSVWVTRKSRVTKGKLLGEKMSSPDTHLPSCPCTLARSIVVIGGEWPCDVQYNFGIHKCLSKYNSLNKVKGKFSLNQVCGISWLEFYGIIFGKRFLLNIH